jgi:hypothetical protein
MTTSPATRDQDLQLHRRLLDGDPVAPSDLAVAYLDHLVAYLARRNPSVDPAPRDTAAEDAIISLCKRPEVYSPDRMPLDRYLCMAAQRDLVNALARERRHTGHQAAWDAVEKSPTGGNKLRDDDADPVRILERQEEADERRRRWKSLVGTTSDALMVAFQYSYPTTRFQRSRVASRASTYSSSCMAAAGAMRPCVQLVSG